MNARDAARQAWLHRVLGAVPARIAPASGDASFRRYFRVHLDGATRIVMDAPPPREDCRPFVAVTGLLASAGLNVPRVIAADLAQGFLLLTDLGDRLYLDELGEGSADALYADALRALIRLQSRGDASTVPPYDAAKLGDEMRLFVDWFLVRHLGRAPSARDATVLGEAFEFLTAQCLAQPRVLVHRDFHSRNLMRTARDNPGVLDYQDAVRGPITYDLVSLLRDVYVRWPEQRVYRWVAEWEHAARDAGLLAGVRSPDVERWFDLTGVQRHLKVAGIFSRLWYRDGKRRYLADIPLTLDYLVGVAARHRELAPLHSWLTATGVAERNLAATAALDADAARS